MRRNIVGGLVAAVGLVLLGTASSFASGMGHHNTNAPVTQNLNKASDEASPEATETPKATPSTPGTVPLIMKAGMSTADENDDTNEVGDSTTGSTHEMDTESSGSKTAPTTMSGDDHESSTPTSGSTTMPKSDD